MLPHRGLVMVSRMFATINGSSMRDVWINPMPMFHTAGCGLVTLGALQTGATPVLPAAFDPAVMLDLFEADSGTLMLSVPTMLIRMLDEQALCPRGVSSWRLSMLGGAPVAPELQRVPVAVDIELNRTYARETPSGVSPLNRPLPGVRVLGSSLLLLR